MASIESTRIYSHWKPLSDFEHEQTNGQFCDFSFVIAHAHGGTIIGTVRAHGKEGAEQTTASGKYQSRQFKFVERVNYEEMRDFIVYIEGAVGPPPVPPKSRRKSSPRATRQ